MYKNQVWKHMPSNPSTLEAETGRSEFKGSLVYTVLDQSGLQFETVSKTKIIYKMSCSFLAQKRVVWKTTK